MRLNKKEISKGERNVKLWSNIGIVIGCMMRIKHENGIVSPMGHQETINVEMDLLIEMKGDIILILAGPSLPYSKALMTSIVCLPKPTHYQK